MMIDRKTIKRALEAAGFVYLRSGWVRKEDAPRLQARIAQAIDDAADDVEAVKSELETRKELP